METIVLNIKGMTCMGCVKSVRNVLEALPGVTSVEITLDKGQANISYDPALVSPSQFKRAVQDAGFEVAG